ncbi:MAG: type II toxin-antitoxin system RelE/ParE family toxin [Actinomycetaceae bacterium]|nr:type II toxin-antitoxin system RelE/ParE family toxin [Arcanobacterium sp.]MDD7687633.1 type II toxin-antitoxin system RelE/ParE family toxin [Actinomycetaceae bacterium]MDY5273128.1 type II toxin-antitoxin system RelE/ParE family toxin [Arcanobacterium sp.]
MEVRTLEEFDTWLGKLRDRNAQHRIFASVRRYQARGDVNGDIKYLGENVSEARFHFGAGYRAYFTEIEHVVIFLLIGGDKSSQQKDIIKAKQLAQKLREEGWE